MIHGRELTIRIWESTWGREGLWCKGCRRATPVAQLLLEPTGRALLPCETCGTTLRTGPSWLTTSQPPAAAPRALAAAPA
jgi:hypothetical protein